MLFRITVVAVWIAVTIAFYLAVALVCRRLRPSPLAAAVYVSVRRAVDHRRWWLWYVLLFLGAITAATAGLKLGIALAGLGEAWRIAVAATTCLAVGYTVFFFRPRPADASRLRRTLIAAAAGMLGIAAGVGYLAAYVDHPGWLVLDIGTFALAVPPLVWFRALKIRTAVCLLTAGAVYDAIHVFGTEWMDTFMDSIRDTPGILRLPRAPKLAAGHFFSLGHGDLLAPGLLVVVAARAADRRKAAWRTAGTLAGAAIGHALAVVVTMAIHRTLPALIVLVPLSCLGYALGAGLARIGASETKPLPTALPQGAE